MLHLTSRQIKEPILKAITISLAHSRLLMETGLPSLILMLIVFRGKLTLNHCMRSHPLRSRTDSVVIPLILQDAFAVSHMLPSQLLIML